MILAYCYIYFLSCHEEKAHATFLKTKLHPTPAEVHLRCSSAGVSEQLSFAAPNVLQMGCLLKNFTCGPLISQGLSLFKAHKPPLCFIFFYFQPQAAVHSRLVRPLYCRNAVCRLLATKRTATYQLGYALYAYR